MHRRALVLTFVPFIVFLLARWVYLSNGLLFGPMPAPWGHSQAAHAPAVLPQKTFSLVTPVAKPAVEAVVSHGLQLRSTLSDYRAVFSGDVTCGGAPCEAELRVTIESEHNDDVRQIYKTNATGHFEFAVPFKENPRQMMDWRMMVYSPRTYPLEVHGRQILTDEADIAIERTLRLP